MCNRFSAPLFLCLAWLVTPLPAQESYSLNESLHAGSQFAIQARVEILDGVLRPPAEKGKAPPPPISVSGSGAMEYEEVILGFGSDNFVNKTLRLVQRTEIRRKLGGQPQENILRPAVRRLVVLRDKQAKAPFSPDGPLLWSEIDLIRTDLFTPMLVGLLPGRNVAINERWSVAAQAVHELTGLDRIDQGGLECTLLGVLPRDGRKIARVGFQGSVRGTNEDGPTRQDLKGTFEFDLDARMISFLNLTGTQTLLAPDGQERGKIEGRLVLQRQARKAVEGLDPSSLARLSLDPTDDNTLLLFDNPELGVKFLYPRRWRIAGIKGNQITMDTPEGDGLLLTIEPVKNLPTGAAYLRESREWVEKQRGIIKDSVAPRNLSMLPALDFLSLSVELAGQPRLLDYYIARQAGGGVLVASSLVPQGDGRGSRLEVKKLAESLTVTRRIER